MGGKESPNKSSPRKSRNPSPRKARSAAKSKPTEDPSTWRESWIRRGTTINKTAALGKYHLKADEISDLTHSTSAGLYGPMYLYNEREVEQKAWVKYGGPTSFKIMLQKKYTIWESKRRIGDFPAPSTYLALIFDGQSIQHNVSTPLQSPARLEGASSPSNTSNSKLDWDTPSPAVAVIKGYFVDRGQQWVWDAIFLAYLGIESEDYIGSGRKDRYAMEAFFRNAKQEFAESYPPRPDADSVASLMDSESFETLKRRLGRAPKCDKDKDENERQEGIVVDAGCYPYSIRSADWVKSYYGSIHRALVDIIEEHGQPGWEIARWLVYDKYVECHLGGVKYDNDSRDWSDDADFWFYPERYKHMKPEEKHSFCVSLEI